MVVIFGKNTENVCKLPFKTDTQLLYKGKTQFHDAKISEELYSSHRKYPQKELWWDKLFLKGIIRKLCKNKSWICWKLLFKLLFGYPIADFGSLSRGQSHSPDDNHWEPRNKVGSLSPAERLVGLNREPSDSYYNALTHYATLSTFKVMLKLDSILDIFLGISSELV